MNIHEMKEYLKKTIQNMTDMEIESEEDLLLTNRLYLAMSSSVVLEKVEVASEKKVETPVVVVEDSEEETDVAPYASDSDSDYRPKTTRKTAVKPKKTTYRKKAIPKALVRAVWARWIGDDVAKTKCLCCKAQEIHITSYHCGHVVAERMGGKLTVENLRPICQMCNSSMGTKNMMDFMRDHGL